MAQRTDYTGVLYAVLLLALVVLLLGLGGGGYIARRATRDRVRLRVVGDAVLQEFDDGAVPVEVQGDPCAIEASLIIIHAAAGSHAAVVRLSECLRARNIRVQLEE